MDSHEAETAMQNNKEYKSYEALRAKQSEIRVGRIIAKGFPGMPGLLVRCLESSLVVNETKISNHSAFTDLFFLFLSENIFNEHAFKLVYSMHAGSGQQE